MRVRTESKFNTSEIQDLAKRTRTNANCGVATQVKLSAGRCQKRSVSSRRRDPSPSPFTCRFMGPTLHHRVEMPIAGSSQHTQFEEDCKPPQGTSFP